MRNLLMVTAVTVAVGGFTASAVADWFPGDGHKMHFPQLPDPTGWDVNGTSPKVLADDWQCSETGFVTDVHFWGSWEGDNQASITNVHLSIHENVPADPLDPTSFSHPGNLLWESDFGAGEFTLLDPYGTGDQGWYDPNTGQWNEFDHHIYNQINIDNIGANPAEPAFFQQVGEIYWLDVSVTVDDPTGVNARWGWKTADVDSYPAPYTGMHFEDDAVWNDGPGTAWQELNDPITGESLDLAFVITPEPSTLGFLALGGLALMGRRGRRQGVAQR